jgi:hypothetical protein
VNSVADQRLFDSILYGVQGTAMPAWIDFGGLTRTDAGNLINFIRNLNQKSGAGAQPAAASQAALLLNRGQHARR